MSTHNAQLAGKPENEMLKYHDIDEDGKMTPVENPPEVGLSTAERVVIRKVLEREIQSYCKSAERNADNHAFDAAAHDHAIRQGISHALFVLAQECGV